MRFRITTTLLLLTFFTYSQVDYKLSIGGGYAISLRDGSTSDEWGRVSQKDPTTGRVTYSDARPKLAEGGMYQIAFQSEFGKHWIIDLNLSFLNGNKWERVNYPENSQYPRTLSTQASSYWVNLDVGYAFWKKKYFDRRNILSNFYCFVNFGGSLLTSSITYDVVTQGDPNLPATQSRLNFKFYDGIGYGLYLGLNGIMPISETLFIKTIIRAEYAVYQTSSMEVVFTELAGTRTERNEVQTIDQQTFPMDHLFFGISAGIKLNP